MLAILDRDGYPSGVDTTLVPALITIRLANETSSRLLIILMVQFVEKVVITCSTTLCFFCWDIKSYAGIEGRYSKTTQELSSYCAVVIMLPVPVLVGPDTMRWCGVVHLHRSSSLRLMALSLFRCTSAYNHINIIIIMHDIVGTSVVYTIWYSK